jgi:ribosomal protein S18 acetylase RimI-like enzyme
VGWEAIVALVGGSRDGDAGVAARVQARRQVCLCAVEEINYAPPRSGCFMSWTIRVGEYEDAGVLPAIERSAGLRFRSIPELAFLADGDDMPVETHRRYIAQGTEWVAVSETGDIVGFLAAEIVGHDLHIWEFAVRMDVQNQGIGRRLIEVACTFARQRKLESLTLTTFTNAPWNAPWYERFGFVRTQDDERLATLVRTESERGWPYRCAMRKTLDSVHIGVGEAAHVEAFLAERVYEYNARATQYFDGRTFSAARRDSSGNIRAGIAGYTWGGCCYISYLWVDEAERGRGVGMALVNAAEEYALSVNCQRMLLSTHSFQAPAFYERLGYKKEAVVRDHPPGYDSFFYGKWLTAPHTRRPPSARCLS